MVQKDEPRPRGRPRAYDPDQALSQAREAFATHGFSGTSLDELSAATGMNRPSLYAAFGDKRALYLETLARTQAGMLAGASAALGAPGDLEASLTRLFNGAIATYLAGEGEARGCFIVGTALTEAVGDPAVKAILHDTFIGLDSRIAERLARAQVEGDLPKGTDPGGLGYMVSTAIHGLAMRARGGEPREALEAWAKATVTHVVSLSKA